MRALPLCCAAVLLTGCLPLPVRHVDAPPFSGTVIQEKSPVAGAEICLVGYGAEQWGCTSTDAYGRFSIPAKRSTSLMMLMGDRLVRYHLEISNAAGQTFIGYWENDIGSPTRADRSMLEPVQLTCDLPTSPHDHSGHAPGTVAPICASSNN